jgi:hypothetical protein
MLCTAVLFPLAAHSSDRSPNRPVFPFPSDFDRATLTATLHSEHPRLFARDDDWQRVRRQMPSSPELAAIHSALTTAADDLLDEPPLERVLSGRRMLWVSREVLKRVLTLGVVYRFTDEMRYFERAKTELLTSAAFSDWNPSHFLDTAEMTLALAVGYDWLYEDLSDTERAVIRQAIVEKGLSPGRGSPEGLGLTRWKPGDGVPKAFTRWKEKTNNWNQVCYTGMVAGALAVAEDEPDLAVEFLHDMYSNIGRSLVGYAPDGAYPEGPGYWGYGTQFTVILISILESSLGQTWDLENTPGLRESAVYINEAIGPTGLFYNYADGGEEVDSMPALHWFAAQQENPAIDGRERRRLTSAKHDSPFYKASTSGNRLFPLSMLWLEPALAEMEVQETLPLHWKGDGPNPVAVHRASWDEDSLFIGIKGGSPSQNHGHMDVGSFVLDDQGVRWASDIKGQGYRTFEELGMDIWDYTQVGDRWRVFSLNSQGHNTLVIDGQNQMVDGFAEIRSFSADPETPFTVVDMTEIYRDWAGGTVRGARLLGGNAVLIHDVLSDLAGTHSVRWGMLTEAEVELNESRAILRRDGKELHARILNPADAVFEIVQTNPPPNAFDGAFPGTRMLALFAKGSDSPTHLKVVFSRRELTPAEIEKAGALPDPTDW